MRLLDKGKSVFDGTINVLAVLGAILIAFVFVTVSLEVVLRYFLHSPMNWVVQTSQYSLIFITFLGAAWVLRLDKHVTMEIVLNRLQPRNQDLLRTITSIAGALICLVLVVYGIQVTLDLFQRGIYDPQVLDVPMAPLVAIIPLGSFMLFLQFLRRGYGYLERWRASPRQRQGS